MIAQRPRPLPLFLDLIREISREDPHLAAQALEGLRVYQDAPRTDPGRRQKYSAQQGRVRLIDYGAKGAPILFVPSIINPHVILDLGEGNSLVHYIRQRGFRPFLLDWGVPSRSSSNEDLGQHIGDYLVPLIKELTMKTGQPPHLVGYCLGGTMAIAAAHLAPVASVSLIAAPWHFDHYGDDRSMLAGLWKDNQEACVELGCVPMEVLQTAFWRMDPVRTVRKFATLPQQNEATVSQFVALEDWANEGAPLTYAAGRELFVDLFDHNMTGNGTWKVAGNRISPQSLPCPARQFVSSVDRIVPLDSCPRGIDHIASPAGHVGMVVGSKARATLWEPLAKWLSQVQHTALS